MARNRGRCLLTVSDSEDSKGGIGYDLEGRQACQGCRESKEPERVFLRPRGKIGDCPEETKWPLGSGSQGVGVGTVFCSTGLFHCLPCF